MNVRITATCPTVTPPLRSLPAWVASHPQTREHAIVVSREEQLAVPVRDAVGHLSEAGALDMVGFQVGECLVEPAVGQSNRVNVSASALVDREQLGDRHRSLEHLEVGALRDR